MKRMRLLGKGGEGSVYHYKDESEGNMAIKFPNKLTSKVDGVSNLLIYDIWRSLRHGNILEFRGFSKKKDLDERGRGVEAYLIHSELLECDLRSRDGELSKRDSFNIIRDVTRALHYLHEIDIIHCDIKEENILLDSNNTAKLCDFGHSMRYDRRNNSVKDLGTKGFRAREITDLHIIDKKSDIFSLGIVFYNLMSDEKDDSYFEGKDDLYIRDKVINHIKDKELADVILLMLKNNVDERISSEGLMRTLRVKQEPIQYYKTKFYNYYLDDEQKKIARNYYDIYNEDREECKALFFGIDLFFRLRDRSILQKKNKEYLFMICIYMGHKYWSHQGAISFNTLFEHEDRKLPSRATIISTEDKIINHLDFLLYNETEYERDESKALSLLS